MGDDKKIKAGFNNFLDAEKVKETFDNGMIINSKRMDHRNMMKNIERKKMEKEHFLKKNCIFPK